MAQPSKPQHAYPARKPGHLPRRALTRLLCVLLALQPMLAQAAPALAQPATLEAPEGKVSLLAKTDTDYVQKQRREADLLWWNARDRGQVKETVRPVEIEAGGGLRIHAGRGVVIEYHKTGDLRASLGQLAEAPGLGWIASLQADPRVEWRGVEAAFREWDYAQSGLTEAGAALVALATAAATWGVSAKLSAALAKALPSAMQGAAMSTALTAGTRTLFMQAGVALVNNQGDIGATLKQLASTDTLRALATAVVTAGLTAHLGDMAGFKLPARPTAVQTTVYKLQTGLLKATVNASLSAAIEGQHFGDALTRGMTTASVLAGLAGVQQSLGDFGLKHNLPEGSLPKLVGHAVAGGLASELAGGEFLDGALAAGLAELSGPLVGDTALTPAQQMELQRLIGTAAVLLVTGPDGNADGAWLAGNIAASAYGNNHLRHTERDRFLAELAACKKAALCLAQVADKYKTLSERNNAALKAAILAKDIETVARIRQDMATDMFAYNDKVIAALRDDRAAYKAFVDVINDGATMTVNGMTSTPGGLALEAVKDFHRGSVRETFRLLVEQFGLDIGIFPSGRGRVGASNRAIAPDSPGRPGQIKHGGTLPDVTSGERKGVAGSGVKALPPAKLADHHLLPRQFKEFFKQRGIDIDQHTVTLGQTNHLRGVHGKGQGEMPGGWNKQWQSFIDKNPNASAKDVYQQLGRMMDDFKLNDAKIHPYRK